MKKLYILIVALVLGTSAIWPIICRAAPSYAGVKWDGYEENIFERSQKAYSPILLFVTADWCQFCKEMDAKTFHDPAIAKYVKTNFIPVISSTDNINLIKRYNIAALPAIIILDGKGAVLEQFSGYRDSAYTMKVLSRAYREYQVS